MMRTFKLQFEGHKRPTPKKKKEGESELGEKGQHMHRPRQGRQNLAVLRGHSVSQPLSVLLAVQR